MPDIVASFVFEGGSAGTAINAGMRRTAWGTEPCVSNKTSMISFADPGPGGINLRTTFTSQFGRLRSLSLCVGFSEFALPALISIEVSSSRSFCRPASQRSNPAHISANRARPSCRFPQDPGTFARENREFTGCNLTNANPKLRQISGRTDIASSCFSR